MIKKHVKYEDFDGNEVEEDVYFHLSKPDLIELEVSIPEGLEVWVTRIVAEENKAELLRVFTMFIRKGYGVRSVDGRHFRKNAQLLEDFESTGAYEAVFMDVLTDTDKLIEFFKGILPAGLSEDAAKLAGIDPTVTPLVVVTDERNPEIISREALASMTTEELQQTVERVKKGEAKIAE